MGGDAGIYPTHIQECDVNMAVSCNLSIVFTYLDRYIFSLHDFCKMYRSSWLPSFSSVSLDDRIWFVKRTSQSASSADILVVWK